MATARAGKPATRSRNPAHPAASSANRSDSTTRPPGSTTTSWWSDRRAQSKPPKWVNRAGKAAESEVSVSLTVNAPAGEKGLLPRPHVKGPLCVDLIRGPRRRGTARPWGDVLSDVSTGVSPRSGDLRLRFVSGWISDRGRGATWTDTR